MKRKKRAEKKTDISRIKTGGILASLIAAAAVFVVMVQWEKKELSQYEKGIIYAAQTEIPKGQLITEENYMRYFREQELDKTCIPPTALSSPVQVQGLIAGTDIEEGVLLTEGMFLKRDEILASMSEPVIAGFKAEDLYQVVGGVLRAGDRVNVYSVKEEGASLVWQDVFVQQVFDASGLSVANGDETTAAQRINVYLEKGDVERFYGELAQGSLRVVKLCR